MPYAVTVEQDATTLVFYTSEAENSDSDPTLLSQIQLYKKKQRTKG